MADKLPDLKEVVRKSSMNKSFKPDRPPPTHGIQQSVPAASAGDINVDSGNRDFFLESEAANKIAMAAYEEIQTKVLFPPGVGSSEEFLQMFRSPPQSGMRVACSIEREIVPIAPHILVSIMMNVDLWASSLSHIVYRGSGHVPTGVLQHLSNMDPAILNIQMVNAEFQLPTPFVQTRKFCFLRWQKEIGPNVWAIVDVSNDYFPRTPSDGTLERKCRRRPSGVIIGRVDDNNSQVIWIENVEVYECQLHDSIYSTIINSNLAFCAKRWVNTLLWQAKRKNSRFVNAKIPVDKQAHTCLLNLTESMKTIYFEVVNAARDERQWVTLSDQRIRILRNITVDHNYIALTSFRVQAKPLSVYHFLEEKNLQLQWAIFRSLEGPEEVIRLATYDNSNRITLHKQVVLQNEFKKANEFLLQEASWDGFCSFVISAPVAELEFRDALYFGRWRDVSLRPSGFAIMPDGSRGLESNASLVTIVLQQELEVTETGQAVKCMRNLINAIIGNINKEVTGRGNASSGTLKLTDLGNQR